MADEKISRAEMLKELHDIVFAANMTYLEYAQCNEVEIYTSQGVSNWQESCQEPWPAYCIDDADKITYAYFDREAEGGLPEYFSSKEELARKMSEMYSNVYKRWDDLSDDELAFYLERYRRSKGDFPVVHVGKGTF